MMGFTHFDGQGNAHMVDVSRKADTDREAVAKGSIAMSRECLRMVVEGGMKKGDVLGVARIAGIMGAKRTSELIPLCHILNLTKLEIAFEVHEDRSRLYSQDHRKDRGGDGSADRGQRGPAHDLRYVQGRG